MGTYTEESRILVSERELVGVAADVPPHKVDGPLAAVLYAAGVGAFVLGLLTTLAEASPGIRAALQMNPGVGPLSGKTVWATIIFVAAWIVLHVLLRQRDKLLRPATIAFLILTALGVLGTFPIFFQAFAPE